MFGKYILLLLSVILLSTACYYETQEEVISLLTEDESLPLEDEQVDQSDDPELAEEDFDQASTRWLKSNMAVDEILKELREMVLSSEDSLLILDRTLSITTKLKGNTHFDFGNLSSDQDDILFRNRLLPLRFDSRMQLFENYRQLRTDFDPFMNELGKSYLQTGEKVQAGFENDFDHEHFIATFDSVLSLEQAAIGTPIEDRVKMLQGSFLMSSFGNKSSGVYVEDGAVDRRFIESFRSYRNSVEDEPYGDFVAWLDNTLDEHDDKYSPEIQADMRMLQVFGSNFNEYRVNRMSETQGKETLQYYDFLVSPYDSAKFINDLTKTIESDIKVLLGFNESQDKSFYLSQSVGTANSDIVSALYYGEVLTENNERIIEKQGYLIDLGSREIMTLDDIFPYSYDQFVKKINMHFMSQYTGKLVHEESFDITSNIPFYLSGDYIYFELPQLVLTEEAMYQTSFWVNIYDYIEHADLERIGR